jgi:hypothetical protein
MCATAAIARAYGGGGRRGRARAEADATPEIALNESIWKSVKGRRARMPRPRHEHIVGSVPTDEGE